jgi:hypothetical protein
MLLADNETKVDLLNNEAIATRSSSFSATGPTNP